MSQKFPPPMNLDIQIASSHHVLPKTGSFDNWASAALAHLGMDNDGTTNLCIRIVDEEEISVLNQSYRNKAGSTNVLSFPATVPEFVVLETKEKSLGDIVLCAPVLEREAKEQGKNSTAHWAHLTVHGVLHLLGYDHEKPEQADQMESLEIAILHQLGFANPY